MLLLNLPKYETKIAIRDGKKVIFDVIRRRYVALTPEEWVRQHVLNYLVTVKNFAASNISVEKELHLNQLKKRYDIVVYQNLKPHLIVECKAPYVNLDESVLEQALRYNLILRAPFLMISNGVSDVVFNAVNEQTSL